MAQTLPKIGSRTARTRLQPRREPYWNQVKRGAHIGYRKSSADKDGERNGTWIAKWRDTETGKRHYKSLGEADDGHARVGAHAIFDYDRAVDEARKWIQHMDRSGSSEPRDGPYTVTHAMHDYISYLAENKKTAQQVEYSLRAFIEPELGNIEVNKLASHRIAKFKSDIAKSPPRRRTKPGEKQKYRRFDADNPEAIRKRKVTSNRVIGVLKAGLSHAFSEITDADIHDDAAWRKVKPYRNVNRGRVDAFLTKKECQKLVNACEPHFRPLVQAALLTGCRYAEITRLQARDFDPKTGKLFIEETKSGKSRYVVLDDEGQRFFKAVCTGHNKDAPMFIKPSGSVWGKSHQSEEMRTASKKAKFSPPITFHAFRHTYASQLIENGAPLTIVAKNLGHADTRMVEKHYGHLREDYVAREIRAAAPKLGITGSQ